MGGIFIDTFAMYVYKALGRLFDFLGSQRWEKVAGRVLDYSVQDSPIGCTLLTVKYQVTADDSWVAIEKIPFLGSRDAERYARRLTPEVKVRIDPSNRTLTRLFARDQKDVCWDRPSNGGPPTKFQSGAGRPPQPGDPGVP